MSGNRDFSAGIVICHAEGWQCKEASFLSDYTNKECQFITLVSRSDYTFFYARSTWLPSNCRHAVDKQQTSKISTNPEWFRKACCRSAGGSLSQHGECWYYTEVLYWFVVPPYRSDLYKESNRIVSSVQLTRPYIGSYKLSHYDVPEVHLHKITGYVTQYFTYCLVMICAIKLLLYFSVVLSSVNFQFCISL